MKKIEKFKIIETGRICSSDEMNAIRGGSGSTTCGTEWTSCESGSKYASCSSGANSTYSDNSKLMQCEADSNYTTCYGGFESQDTCTKPSPYYVCGIGTTYAIIKS